MEKIGRGRKKTDVGQKRENIRAIEEEQWVERRRGREVVT